MHRLDSSHSVIRLLLIAPRRLDCDALLALFQSHARFRVVCATTELRVAVEIVRYRRPDLVVLDGALIEEHVANGVGQLMERLGGIPLLVLDDDIKNGRLAAVLQTSGTGYFTRHVPFDEIAKGIDLLLRGQRAFGPHVLQRVQQTSRGWALRTTDETALTSMLTPREIEVLKLIALGHSIKHCAEVMELAPSTVDNHKARLMKKLGVHKSLDLTRLAIREGLVSV